VSLRPIHWILTVTLASVAATSSHADGLSFTTNYFNGDERIQSCSDIEMRFWREGGSSDIVTSRRSQTLSLGANGAKSLKIEGSNRGGVRVQPSTDGKASALICMAAGATSDKAAEAILDRLSVVNQGGVLRVDGPEDDDDWAGMIVLSVPDAWTLDMSATNGPLQIGNVNGQFTLRTTNGPIKVANVGGVVDARAQNGPIKFVGHSGDVSLVAQNGPISVDLDAKEWNGKRLEASTQNGPLKLSVPDDMKSGVEVTSARWAPWSGAWRSAGDPDSRTYRIGDDPVRVRLSTVNGPVKIRGPQPKASKAHGVEI